MKGVWGILALVVVLVLGGGGCRGGEKAGEGGKGEEKPRLEAWDVPIADVPKLLSGDVRAIAVDKGGALWFGTDGGGVSRYDPKSGAWKTFTEKDGLAANVVHALAVDAGGALWVGTNGGGVSRYEPQSGAWKTFTEKDGLAANLPAKLMLPTFKADEGEHALVMLVSILAPYYALYRTLCFFKENVSTVTAPVSFELSVYEQPYGQAIAEEIETTFGYERMPPEIGNVIVPGVCVRHRAQGEATIFDSLFTDHGFYRE